MPIYDLNKLHHMGRPKGSPNKHTKQERWTLAQLCKGHSKRAIEILVEIMDRQDAKDSDRLTAAIAILDRAYGKPISSIEMLDDNGNAVTPQVCFYIPDNGRKLENDFNDRVYECVPKDMETSE